MSYSNDAKETVILSTDIVMTHSEYFNSWQHTSKVKDGEGTLRMYSESGIQKVEVDLYIYKGLWYIKQNTNSQQYHEIIIQ